MPTGTAATRYISLLCAAVFTWTAAALRSEMPNHSSTTAMLFGNSIQEYYVSEARQAAADRQLRLDAITTAAEAQSYIGEVREKIRHLFALPVERCELSPQITREERINGLAVRHVIYWSRPGYPVTAMLHLPEDCGRPSPAVLLLCGHSQEGKDCSTYQTAAVNLARQGFVVLIPDPVGQGERLQFTGSGGPDEPVYCCFQHNSLGKSLALTGEFFGAWRAWDAIRGIDYLRSLPEVDSSRIGITGCSGGGTMATFVNALEERVMMAAPSSYITTWLHNIENELPVDCEQIPPAAMALGLDIADFVIARAPRPTIIMAQANDFFDCRGARQAFAEARAIYRLLGAEENLQLTIGPGGHGYSSEHRQAMYGFFNRHAMARDTPPREDASLASPSGKSTWCLPEGNVSALAGARPLYDFTREKARRLAVSRPDLTAAELRGKLSDQLKIGRIEAPGYRILRPGTAPADGIPAPSRFGLETEPGRVMSVLKRYDGPHWNIPGGDGMAALLYIPHLDADREIAPVLSSAGGMRVFALDIRGIGEMTPSGCDQYSRDFFGDYLFDYHYNSLGILMGRPYLGGKVRDILCALELLKAHGCADITLMANGMGAVPALLAAAVAQFPGRVVLASAPSSWQSMAEKPYTKWPASCMLPGVLSYTDLPQIRALLPQLEASFADEPEQPGKAASGGF